MSMADSVARYEKAGLAARYHWWDRDYALRMLKELHAALEASSDGILCCQPGLKPADDNEEPGAVTLWLYVMHNGAAITSHDVFNSSHGCPPFCG